jgi:hypothetical protein
MKKLLVSFLIIFDHNGFDLGVRSVCTDQHDTGDRGWNYRRTGRHEAHSQVGLPNQRTLHASEKRLSEPLCGVEEPHTFSSIFELTNTKVTYDDAKNSILVDADLIGAVVNRKDRWEFNLGKGAEMVHATDQMAIFVLVSAASSEEIIFTTMKLNLPSGCSELKYDPASGIFSFNMKRKNVSGSVSADVNVKVKPRIMSALYKVYGMPDVMDGAYWVAKFILTNKGKGDIVDLRISYKLGDYTSWSAESVYDVVPPNGAIVDLYYPIISSNVTQLRSQTPVDLQVKYSYKDRSGKTYSDTIIKRIQILGVNQFEFSNVPEEERTGAWVDNFSNSPLLAAFVTHLDDVVKSFAGLVSQYSGGVAAASKDKDAIAFLKALYDLAVSNGISYQTPSGFLVEYASLGQDVKYPRDVLRDKAGTCLDLAVLFAAVSQAVSLKSYLVIVPGHAFPVIELPSGDIMAIESTGLGGPVVGKSATFEQAVEMGTEQLGKLEFGKFFIVDIAEMQRKGVLSPELPQLPSTILKDWGYTLPRAGGTTTTTQPQAGGTQPRTTQPATIGVNLTGTFRGTYKNNVTGQQGTLEFYIEQSGNKVEGTVWADQDMGDFTGTVSGNNVRITAKMESYAHDAEYVVIFNGTVQGNTIQGNYTIQGTNVSGTFQVKRTQ